MLIHAAIERAKIVGALLPFVPPVTWVPKPRAFLMTKRLAAQISEAIVGSDAVRQERWERLRADIAHFVGNGRVNEALLKQLDPHKFEHWELRSVRPKPSIRVFGRFAEPDVFVGTHAVERRSLGAKWSLEWEIEKLICEEEWRAALGECAPFQGTKYTDYITENAQIFPDVPR
jgi:hypothetical protein